MSIKSSLLVRISERQTHNVKRNFDGRGRARILSSLVAHTKNFRIKFFFHGKTGGSEVA